jgi:predicted acylesterase/phospholipase RssA
LKRKRKRIPALVLPALLCVAACAHYPHNAELDTYDAETGYRYPPPAETAEQDRLFIALAFSGGGTRAAALSYGVLKKLAATPIPGRDRETLLDEVDVISSVSGGSFTAAYYGLFGERIFQDFEPGFLYRDVQGDLVGQMFNPWNWVRLASPTFSRIDLAAELYDKTIYRGATYQSLVDRGRHPFIALNATNLATGSRFTFTQDQFDLLGSDQSSFPVARAVAASSAFPFLLSPVTLVNHPAAAGYDLPTDMKLGLEGARADDRRYLWARNRAVYHEDKDEHPYLHLMDGGLADNLGLRYLADGYRRTSGFLTPRKGTIEHLVVIAVNAKTQPPEDLDRRASPPGLKKVAFKTATVSMDNYTFETVQMARELLEAGQRDRRIVEACQRLVDRFCGPGHSIPKPGQTFRVHVVEINFLQVSDPERRERLLALPTTFSLQPDQVADLMAVGGELLEQSKDFQDLLKELTGEE